MKKLSKAYLSILLILSYLLCQIGRSNSFTSSFFRPVRHCLSKSLIIWQNLPGKNVELLNNDGKIPPTFEDMKYLAFILTNITETLGTQPEVALSIASKELGWLYSRNVPKLIEMLIERYPSLRDNSALQKGYMFLVDFLEIVAKETSELIVRQQEALKKVLDAAKISEQRVDEVIREYQKDICTSDFLLYLDTEIETFDDGSPSGNSMTSMLVTIKLRILDEMGKDMGLDVTIIPMLATEDNPLKLKEKTLAHLRGHDEAGRALFLQTLRIIISEMDRRYERIDPMLKSQLKEIETIVQSCVGESW